MQTNKMIRNKEDLMMFKVMRVNWHFQPQIGGPVPLDVDEVAACTSASRFHLEYL